MTIAERIRRLEERCERVSEHRLPRDALAKVMADPAAWAAAKRLDRYRDGSIDFSNLTDQELDHLERIMLAA